MRHIMAIYDVDPLYAARFADVVNQTEKIPFDVLAFSSFDKLKKFAKENPVELLLISSAVSREEAEELGAGKVMCLAERLYRLIWSIRASISTSPAVISFVK